jgi:OOP family OmpA-OmpF porin
MIWIRVYEFIQKRVHMKLLTSLSLILLAATSTAFADGFYVLGEATHSDTSLSNTYFDNTLTTAGATGLTSSDKGKSTQWRLQGGYRFNPNFALEAGYMDLGKSKYTASYNQGAASGELKSGGIDVAALGILPLSDSFSIFGKAGIIGAKTDSKLTATGLSSSSWKSTTHEILPLVGVGATYKLSQNFDLRADYDYVSGIGKSSKTGVMKSNMISVGVAYNF